MSDNVEEHQCFILFFFLFNRNRECSLAVITRPRDVPLVVLMVGSPRCPLTISQRPCPLDWFQPWPREALFSVGRKFLSEMDLGSDGIRAAIEKFLPLSFKVVNTAAESFKAVERRWVMVCVFFSIAACNACNV